MPMWNPWHGCKKCSEGFLHCYIHKGDAKRGVDTSMIIKTKDFDKPVAQLKKGGYKMKPGLVYLGFSTDFLIEEADAWRSDCWKMIKERADCNFLFLIKRITVSAHDADDTLLGEGTFLYDVKQEKLYVTISEDSVTCSTSDAADAPADVPPVLTLPISE